MPASLKMTPPLGPSLEQKWRTRTAHQGAMLDGSLEFSASAAPLHAVLRLLARHATPPDCRAGASRTIPTSRPDRGVRRRQPAPPPPMLPIFMLAPHASPPATPRRAFSQLSIPPASQDSAFSDEKAVGEMPACTPLSCMSPALRSGIVTYSTRLIESITQRTRTPFFAEQHLTIQAEEPEPEPGTKNASPA